MTPRILPFALSAAAFAAACDGCNEPLAPIGDAPPLTVVEDQIPPLVEKEEPRLLTYVGDDPMTLFRGGQATLRFSWKTANGVPVPNDTVAVSASGSSVALTDASFTTDAGGGVAVPVVAGALDGETIITATAIDQDGSVRDASVRVRVTVNPESGLRVTVRSEARIPVVAADTRLLLGANVPTCAALLGGAAEPTPQATALFSPLPSTQDFAPLPTGARATLVATGLNARGLPVARGCSDVAALPGGVQVESTVTLQQDPSVLAGDYDVLMHAALGDALPAPYDATVELVTALLADPAGYAMYVALREVDRASDGFTQFVSRNGEELSYRQVEQEALDDPNAFLTWQVGRANLDRQLEDQVGQTYVDVTNVGAGIRDVITDFEVGAHFRVEDLAGGALQVSEAWREVVLYWPLPCDDGDLACARRVLSLDDPSLAPVTTTYAASWTHAPEENLSERFFVTTEPHGLNVRYGALLLAILDQVVFPSLPTDVAGDSLGDVLSNLVQCDDVAASVVDDPLASMLIASVCEAGISYASAEIEQQLIALQVDSVNPELGQDGLSSSGTFALTDADMDLTTESLRGFTFAVAWNDPSDAAATADIAAPITGDGVRRWMPCTDDGTCAAGFTCQPRASYLKVARVEMGCGRPVGGNAGGATCTADAECQSGVCSPVGVGGALACFDACDELADCGAQQVCSDVGGSLSLDGTMEGLGDVALRGCAAL